MQIKKIQKGAMVRMNDKVVTVGAKGYATTHIHPLLDDMYTGRYTYAGAVAIDIEECKFYDLMIERNIPTYKTLEEYFEAGNTADLVVISTPTHLHFPQTMVALKNGANVLCEKPVAPLYEDALMMQKTADEKGKFVAIGYQWSYAHATRNLKKDILSGKFGKAKQLKSFVSWPRPWEYYENTWKGKLRDKNGVWILDSIANNAAAHYLHNMYFLLGDAMDESAYPKSIRSELLRANDIETFDTCLLDITTENDVKIFYAVSHASGEKQLPPKFELKFENGVVRYNMGGEKDHIVAEFNDGTIKDYGNPADDYDIRLWESIEAAKTGEKLVCTAKTAAAHTFTINQLHKKGEIITFPEELIVRDSEKKITSVKNLLKLLEDAFERTQLLSDMGVEWAKCVEFDVER